MRAARDRDIQADHPAHPGDYHWDGMFYWSAKHKRGIVFIFRPNNDQAQLRVRLKGLSAAKRYRVRSKDGSVAEETRAGGELMAQGLRIKLPQKFSSDLIFITEVGEGGPVHRRLRRLAELTDALYPDGSDREPTNADEETRRSPEFSISDRRPPPILRISQSRSAPLVFGDFRYPNLMGEQSWYSGTVTSGGSSFPGTGS